MILSMFQTYRISRSVQFYKLSISSILSIIRSIFNICRFSKSIFYSSFLFAVKNNYGSYDIWDEFTQKLLYQMETESNLELKRVYGRQLHQLIECLGIGATRWLTSLLSVISSYTLSITDQQCRIDALENLGKIMESCEERVKFHCDNIFETLIRLLYETSKISENSEDSNNSENSKILHLIEQNLQKIAKLCPDEFALQFADLNEVHVNEVFDRVISDLFNSQCNKG